MTNFPTQPKEIYQRAYGKKVSSYMWDKVKTTIRMCGFDYKDKEILKYVAILRLQNQSYDFVRFGLNNWNNLSDKLLSQQNQDELVSMVTKDFGVPFGTLYTWMSKINSGDSPKRMVMNESNVKKLIGHLMIYQLRKANKVNAKYKQINPPN